MEQRMHRGEIPRFQIIGEGRNARRRRAEIAEMHERLGITDCRTDLDGQVTSARVKGCLVTRTSGIRTWLG